MRIDIRIADDLHIEVRVRWFGNDCGWKLSDGFKVLDSGRALGTLLSVTGLPAGYTTLRTVVVFGSKLKVRTNN
jgi:hypothetical protein